MTQDKKNYRKKIISFYKVSLSKKFLEKFSTVFYKVSLSKKNIGKYNDEKKAQIILGFYVNR